MVLHYFILRERGNRRIPGNKKKLIVGNWKMELNLEGYGIKQTQNSLISNFQLPTTIF